ncbi:helix-turn-helix transcriptional regulator [Chitinophaga pendula]|uniref:helix-turn-helix domain-containing protein n=1 Tax=Chitinophaga TaxID=79328 RepID=UPI000BAEAFC2|nr:MULTISPECIES: helix-turn-helix transcriptional regulator [Chitinophaga]ASZ12205.1 AraC family transcriptional regulator [Chitinophaga sp. MD30]UCJ04765.1 helix-turn-helix transcriptional regulator [Chitinophaga pendula]
MKVQTVTPPPQLAGIVSHIVVLENNSMFFEAVLPLIANGYPSITFQLTDPARILHTDKRRDQLVLYGQNTFPIQLHTAGEIMVIAFFLHPFLLQPLFGFAAKELTDQCIDLSTTRIARENNLREQLLNAPSLTARLNLLSCYITQLARSAKETDDRIAFAAQLIRKNNGAILLMDLQKQLYVTERTLQRLFEQQIGLTPKAFSRICQFQAALQRLNNNNFTNMIDVALECGYADQSHLIRAFKEFTTHSPLEYSRQANDFPG